MMAGKLRHRATLCEQKSTKNDIGETEYTLTPKSSLLCEVLDSSKESENIAEGTEVQTYTKLRARFSRLIKAGMFLQLDGDTLEIIDVNNVQRRNRELIITAVAYQE